jgi:hypothetical protein
VRRWLERRAERKRFEELVAEERRNMRHPMEIVIRAMMSGRVIEIGDLSYTLDPSRTRLLWKRKGSAKIELKPGQENVVTHEPWFNSDITFTQFLRECQKIPRDDLFIIGANTALTEINQKGGPSRL